MRIEPEIAKLDIVLVGEFNPTIFTPHWFSANKLIREGAAENASLRVVHPDFTSFTTDRVQVQVTRERFVAGSTQAPFTSLRNFVHRTFREHLFHTPFRAFGINFSVHFLVGSPEVRDRIGNTLAPLEPWGSWRERLNLDGRHGGMASLRMTQTRPLGRASGGR